MRFFRRRPRAPESAKGYRKRSLTKEAPVCSWPPSLWRCVGRRGGGLFAARFALREIGSQYGCRAPEGGGFAAAAQKRRVTSPTFDDGQQPPQYAPFREGPPMPMPGTTSAHSSAGDKRVWFPCGTVSYAGRRRKQPSFRGAQNGSFALLREVIYCSQRISTSFRGWSR